MQTTVHLYDRQIDRRSTVSGQWTWSAGITGMILTSMILFLIAVTIVLSLIPTYLTSRGIRTNNLFTPVIIVNYGTNVKNPALLAVINGKAMTSSLMKMYGYHNIVVDYAKFFRSSTFCYSAQDTTHENVGKCQRNTGTTGYLFVIAFTIRYPLSCHTTSCRQQFLSKIYSDIETTYHDTTLPITFLNGQTIDVKLNFCLFGLGDEASNISTRSSKSAQASTQINNLNSINYYINSYPTASLPFQIADRCSDQLNLVPLTVINGALTATRLNTTLTEWISQDDVISTAFFESFFLPDVSSLEMSSIVNNLTGSSNLILSSTNTESSTVDGVTYIAANGITIPNGPYFIFSNDTHINFYQVYRLYRDNTNSFMYGIVPTQNSSFETIRAAVLNDNTPTVAVPSRLYYTITEQQPLAGLRVAVKDIYDIVGTKRGCGNRAYFELYPVANRTAFSVQRLIDKGAILVGKVKTSQFANGQVAIADWVDYQCPFNPRGDGYQQPSSSSSGSAASMAAYDWLDIAIGSDTGGSIRQPAGQQGLYGIRPSHGAISLDGVMPLCSALDTAGFFARDTASFERFGKAWYDNQFTSYSNFPKTILYSSEFLSQSSPVVEIFQSFANRLSTFLGSNGLTLYNVSSAFLTSNITDSSLESYYNETYTALIGHYQYYNLAVGFINDYKGAFDGRIPFIDPVPLVRWEFGYVNISNTSYENQLTRINQLSIWWNNVVQPANSLTCSENIFIYPLTNATASYRNIYLSPAKPDIGYMTVYISPFVGNPDIAVPIGQAPYNSTITLRTEYLPVTVGVMAHVGCDYMLLELIKQLGDANILQPVQTGRMTF